MPFTDPDFAVETLLCWDPYERCERSPVERWRRESDFHECSCSRLQLLVGERTSFSGADICAALLHLLLLRYLRIDGARCSDRGPITKNKRTNQECKFFAGF